MQRPHKPVDDAHYYEAETCSAKRKKARPKILFLVFWWQKNLQSSCFDFFLEILGYDYDMRPVKKKAEVLLLICKNKKTAQKEPPPKKHGLWEHVSSQQQGFWGNYPVFLSYSHVFELCGQRIWVNKVFKIPDGPNAALLASKTSSLCF